MDRGVRAGRSTARTTVEFFSCRDSPMAIVLLVPSCMLVMFAAPLFPNAPRN